MNDRQRRILAQKIGRLVIPVIEKAGELEILTTSTTRGLLAQAEQRLQALQAEPGLADMMVTKRGMRLSIQPVTKAEFETVRKMGRRLGS